jgi:hypothetical protein
MLSFTSVRPECTRAGHGRLRCLAVVTLIALVAISVFAQAASAGPKPSPYLAKDQALVNHYAAVEGAKLGVNLPGGATKFLEVIESSKYVLKVETAHGKKATATGETRCVDEQGDSFGKAAKCEIELPRYPHVVAGELRPTIAHEVFHAFQAVMAGTVERFEQEETESEWLIEGSATWVESDLISPDPGAHGWWATYLKTPRRPLTGRSYDAVGFFGHLASSGISLWSKFRNIFEQSSPQGAYEAAIGGNREALNSEASAFFRKPAFGREWDQQGPNVPAAAEVGFKAAKVKVPAGAKPVTLEVAPYADGAYELSISAPVVELGVSGGAVRLRSTDGSGVDEVEPTRLVLCGDPHGCSCPGQPASHDLKFNQGDLAISAGPGGGRVKLVARARCESALPDRSCQGLIPRPRGAVSEQLQPADQLVPGLSLPEPKNNLVHPSECTFWAAPNPETGAKQLVGFDWLFVWDETQNRPPPEDGGFVGPFAEATSPPQPISYDYGIGSWSALATQPETVTESSQWVGEPPEFREVPEVHPESATGEVLVRNDEFVVFITGSAAEARLDLLSAAHELDPRSEPEAPGKTHKSHPDHPGIQLH